MKAIKDLVLSNEDLRNNLKINFTGQVNDDFMNFVKKDDVLSQVTVLGGSVPHQELIKLYEQSSALLLILTGYKDGEGFLPGKLFEYLATGLPIVAVGPISSDANALLHELGRDGMIASDNDSLIKARVLLLFENWKRESIREKQSDPSRYSRKQLTFKLSELLKSI
jgi:glycosyltransferase involved in cell wall biosynthesis